MDEQKRELEIVGAQLSGEKPLVSKTVKSLFDQVGESGIDIVDSCNRFLASLTMRHKDKFADLIYRLGEPLQNEGDESFLAADEIFRAWWYRHVQWPTYRNHPETCSLGPNSWLPRISKNLVEMIQRDPSTNFTNVPATNKPEMGDNHVMDFVSETEMSYKAVNEIKTYLGMTDWTLRLPKEEISIEIARYPNELRETFIDRSVKVMDKRVEQLLVGITGTIGGISSEIIIPKTVDNPEDFLVRRLFGEKVNAIALDMGADEVHRNEVDEITKFAALRFGFLRRKRPLEEVGGRIRKLLIGNLSRS